jgi:hypothetical protein
MGLLLGGAGGRGWRREQCAVKTWGVSENNRRARFYSLTRAGQKQLAAETENWERIAAVMGRVLASEGGDP